MRANSELFSLDEMKRRSRIAAEQSTADATAIVWIETLHGSASSNGTPARPIERRRTIAVKVREGRRFGTFRTGHGEPADLQQAIRQAIAVSRGQSPSELQRSNWSAPKARGDSSSGAPPPRIRKLFDQNLADLDPAAARERLCELIADGPGDEAAHLTWCAAHVALRAPNGLSRTVRVTSATLVVDSGSGTLAGHACSSGRRVDQLDASAVVRSARARRAEAAGSSAGVQSAPVLFSQQATAALVIQLNRHALSASTFRDGSSALGGLIGEHVFSPQIALIDNGLDPSGLPFPFDLAAEAKHRIEMIIDGVPRSPAVDDELAVTLGLPKTPHVVGHDESRAENLFLITRESEEAVLAAAEGGLFVNTLALDCHDPQRLGVRLHASGVRRVRDGCLAEGLPDLVWDESLLRLFSQVRAIGGTPVPLAIGGFLGAVSAPLLAVEGPPAFDIARPRS